MDANRYLNDPGAYHALCIVCQHENQIKVVRTLVIHKMVSSRRLLRLRTMKMLVQLAPSTR
jgi:hypothetical protein